MLKKINNNYMKTDKIFTNNWKAKNKKYLLELEKFLDKAESIKDESLKREIIIQMLKCDEELTLSAEKIFKENMKVE